MFGIGFGHGVVVEVAALAPARAELAEEDLAPRRVGRAHALEQLDLGAADGGILFQPPQTVIDEFPQYPVARSYDDLRREFIAASNGEIVDD